MKLEDLHPDAAVRGIRPGALVTVVRVEWHGSDVLTLVDRGPDGRVTNESGGQGRRSSGRRCAGHACAVSAPST